MIPGFGFRKKFSDLSEKEILALAISSEEDDAAIYRNYAEHLKNDYPDTSKIFVYFSHLHFVFQFLCTRFF